ncbi:hypothetical protein [Actinophytocola sediminis]
MSTAHDHYREAERLLDGCSTATKYGRVYNVGAPLNDGIVAIAQVHATLALAAAHGADKPAVTVDNIRTVTAAQGEEIGDQMGGTPNNCNHERCWFHDVQENCHVDEKGVYFRA